MAISLFRLSLSLSVSLFRCCSRSQRRSRQHNLEPSSQRRLLAVVLSRDKTKKAVRAHAGERERKSFVTFLCEIGSETCVRITRLFSFSLSTEEKRRRRRRRRRRRKKRKRLHSFFFSSSTVFTAHLTLVQNKKRRRRRRRRNGAPNCSSARRSRTTKKKTKTKKKKYVYIH